MVCNSLFTLSSPSSCFPSTSTSSTFAFRKFRFSRRILWVKRPCDLSPQLSIRACSMNAREDESAELFQRNNSIADFMRFRKADSAELQTAVVSYRKKFPWSLLQPFLQVDLVSTIHIADKEYFSNLQKALDDYDCVLYEMVASRESLERRQDPNPSTKLQTTRSRGFNIIGCIQRQMARILALDFQLDCLDYESDNWYHADLDFETFKLLQVEKGESFFTFARDMTLRTTKAMVQPVANSEELGPWKSKLLWASRFLPMPLVGLVIIGSVCADMDSQASDYPELEALSRLDFGNALKVFLAKRLTSEFTQLTADVEEKSVIIGERNKAATRALRRAIDAGHTKIAVLYGGGHMPDLGRRLREEFGLVPSEVQWITAWSIRSNRKLSGNSIPLLKKMAEVLGWPLDRYQTLALVIFSSVLALDLLFWELFFGTTADWASNTVSELFHYINNDWLVM